MINNNKFNEIFKTTGHTQRLEKERRIAHYQAEADKAIEEALIESYKATGRHPCDINVLILVCDLQEELGVQVSVNALKNFRSWLEQEIQRVGDYD